ncbi:MAG TPA: glycosyltransferase family 39 protein [Planctomycetota bacterium]|nr:glycosyltransferase family 39 protein [Planctomycetota bacterium]
MAVVAVVRLAAVLVVPVLPEEAYHWLYAKHLDIGYYDHPPMIAGMIALGTAIFGDNTFGIRLIPWLASIGTAMAAAWTAQRLYGRTAAAWTAILISLQPATLVASTFAFPDAPLLFFWALALAFLVEALETRRGAWWLAAGAALGAALLSKYTSCFLGASVFLYLILSPRDRFWLKTPWPYLGILVAFVLFSPVVVWNVRHDWASFRFQSVGRLEESRGFRWTSGPAYLLLQIGSVAPLTFPLAIAAVRWGFRQGSPDRRFLLSLSLPLLLFFFCVGVSRSTHAFWPLAAWIALTILMSGMMAGGDGPLVRFYASWWRVLAAVMAVFVAVGIVHSTRPIPGLASMRSLRGWDGIAARAAGMKATLSPGSFYIGVGKRYLCPSQLAFHLPAPFEVHAKNLLGDDGLQFTYWSRIEALRGRDAVIVAESDWSATIEQMLGKYFRRVDRVGPDFVVDGPRLGMSAKGERYSFYVGREYDPRGIP